MPVGLDTFGGRVGSARRLARRPMSIDPATANADVISSAVVRGAVAIKLGFQTYWRLQRRSLTPRRWREHPDTDARWRSWSVGPTLFLFALLLPLDALVGHASPATALIGTPALLAVSLPMIARVGRRYAHEFPPVTGTPGASRKELR